MAPNSRLNRILALVLVFQMALPSNCFAAVTCKKFLAQIINPSLAKKRYSPQQLTTELDGTSLSPWKKRLIYALWSEYAKRGHQFVNWGTGAETTMWLPYAADIPRNLTESLIAITKTSGLTAGERYLTIPARAILTEGVRHFYGNVFLVLSFGAGGKILGAMGILQTTPMIDQTDPSVLEEGEVILLIKMSDKQFRFELGGAAGNLFEKQINYLQNNYPTKFVLLDLSNDGGNSSTGERIAQIVAQLSHENRRIRKVIVDSHGSPGMIYGDRTGGVDIESFGRLLAPIRPYFSSNPEFHLGGCMIGGSKEGRAAIDRFGDRLLPTGGSVHSSRFIITGSAFSPDGLIGTRKHNVDPIFISRSQQVITPIHPTAGESIGLIMQGTQILASRVLTQFWRSKYNTDPWIIFQPSTYRHFVVQPVR